jgi:hypothetical protein
MQAAVSPWSKRHASMADELTAPPPDPDTHPCSVQFKPNQRSSGGIVEAMAHPCCPFCSAACCGVQALIIHLVTCHPGIGVGLDKSSLAAGHAGGPRVQVWPAVGAVQSDGGDASDLKSSFAFWVRHLDASLCRLGDWIWSVVSGGHGCAWLLPATVGQDKTRCLHMWHAYRRHGACMLYVGTPFGSIHVMCPSVCAVHAAPARLAPIPPTC